MELSGCWQAVVNRDGVDKGGREKGEGRRGGLGD